MYIHYFNISHIYTYLHSYGNNQFIYIYIILKNLYNAY